MSKTVRRLTIGAVIATGVGFVAGLLTAPKKGSETRSDINQASQRIISEAEKQLKHLHAELMTQCEITSCRAKELKGTAQKEADTYSRIAHKAKDKAGEVIFAFRDGEATDADLKKALKEAEQAINDVKKFLSK